MRDALPAGFRWGALALGFLAVTVLSGVGLVPLYRPEAPLESVEALQAGIPWAFVLRGVHAYAALGFLLATFVHLFEVLRTGGTDRLSGPAWWRSTMLLPLAVGAMLTGFVMRGDAEALAALRVWRGVLCTIPGVGDVLATLLLGPAGSGLDAVALHHVGTFTVLPWLLSIEHGRRAWPDGRSWVVALAASVAAAGVLPVPLGPLMDGGHLLGPWYLWGLQGMLLDLPAATAWIVPAAVVGAVGSLPWVRGRGRTALMALLAAAAIAWAAWTVRLWLAMGA